jgi:hypothetical protein
MTIKAPVYFGLPTLLLAASPVAQAQPDEAASSLNALKQLVGIWRVADKPASPLRIRFALTAGGTVLVESWSRGDQPHSLTVYHRDGAGLVATHYCPQGNQPRLALVARSPRGRIQFAFQDATDLDVARESYLIALSFDVSDLTTLVRREVYRQDGTDTSSELKLVRELQK